MLSSLLSTRAGAVEDEVDTVLLVSVLKDVLLERITDESGPCSISA